MLIEKEMIKYLYRVSSKADCAEMWLVTCCNPGNKLLLRSPTTSVWESIVYFLCHSRRYPEDACITTPSHLPIHGNAHFKFQQITPTVLVSLFCVRNGNRGFCYFISLVALIKSMTCLTFFGFVYLSFQLHNFNTPHTNSRLFNTFIS